MHLNFMIYSHVCDQLITDGILSRHVGHVQTASKVSAYSLDGKQQQQQSSKNRHAVGD